MSTRSGGVAMGHGSAGVGSGSWLCWKGQLANGGTIIAHVVRTDLRIRGWSSYQLLVFVRRMGSCFWVMGHVSGAERNGVDSVLGSIGGQILNHCTSGALSIAQV